MIKNRKVFLVVVLSLLLCLLLIGLVFFINIKIIKYNRISKLIINSLRENNFEKAINLINNETDFKNNLYFLPVIRDGIQLRHYLKKIDNNLEDINNGFLLASMLQQNSYSNKHPLSYLENINECLDYLDRYNIDYIRDKKNYLQNWLLFFGNDKPKNYLVLFQEPEIPRPTGGFIGAYAILSFDKGKIEFSGNNIFALEEVFLENIIPPGPLQFISDKWFFHDTNWFFDFPSSSQKILSFYSGAGMKPLLDGVILVNPSVLERLLENIGPVSIKEYDLIIDQHNFYSFFKNQIQEGAKPAPMRQEAELFPLFLESLQKKLKKTSPEILSHIPDILIDGFKKKEVQIYVSDDKLEYFFDSFNWTGRIEESKDDYLGVVFNSLNKDFSEDKREKIIKLKTEFVSGGEIINTLTVSAVSYPIVESGQEVYLKIYLPRGIIIKEAKNGYLKKNKDSSWPYEKLGYKKDDDLSMIENTKIRNEQQGIEIYEEGEKTVVATWAKLSLRPFILVYKLPFNWRDFLSWKLKVQKQSGQNVKFSYQFITPDDVKIIPTLFPFNKLIPLDEDIVVNLKKEL